MYVDMTAFFTCHPEEYTYSFDFKESKGVLFFIPAG